MHLAFTAKEVIYSEAIGGDIVQVSFQEEPYPELDYSKELPPPIKQICFSACYEFPPHNTDIEWCDGAEYDREEDFNILELTKNKLQVVVGDGLCIEVDFHTDDATFTKIEKFLARTNE